MNITINEAGVIHLKDSLSRLYKKYANMDEANINQWLVRVEDKYRDGKGAVVQVMAHESITGKSELIKFSYDHYLAG